MTVERSGGLLQADMEELERELQAMFNGWSEAAGDMVRLTAQIERLKAPQRMTLKKQPPPGLPKPTKEDLDALVLTWLWEEQEDLMLRQLDAEALCVAFGTKYKVASSALSSKQTRLNADIKLHGNGR